MKTGSILKIRNMFLLILDEEKENPHVFYLHFEGDIMKFHKLAFRELFCLNDTEFL